MTRHGGHPDADRGTMTSVTTRARRQVVRAAAAVALAAPALLAAARWPSWWAWIAPEQTPMTWLQSVTLVLAAAGALLVAHVLALTDDSAAAPVAVAVDDLQVDVRDRAPASATGAATPGGSPVGARTWRLLAAGLAGLAVDERFALHERLRDGVLAPRDVTVPFLPWVGPGDFLLLAVGVVGLAVLPVVLRALGPDAGARRALLVGVALAVVAVGMDSIDPSSWTTGAERVEQTVEEVIELASALSLLCAVGLRLLGLVDTPTADTPPEPTDRPAAAAPPEGTHTDATAH